MRGVVRGIIGEGGREKGVEKSTNSPLAQEILKRNLLEGAIPDDRTGESRSGLLDKGFGHFERKEVVVKMRKASA